MIIPFLTATAIASTAIAVFAEDAKSPFVRELSPGEKASSCLKPEIKNDPQAFQLCMNIANGNKDARDCGTLKGKLDEAIGNLASACGKVGLVADSKECADHLRSCTNKGGKDDDGDSTLCPQKGADWEKKKDDAQKIQDDIEKLKADLGGINDKMAEAKQAAQEKVSNLQEKMSKAQSEITKAQAQMSKELTHRISDQQKQVAQSVQQKQQAYDRISIDIKGVPIEKQAARIKTYDEPVTNLRITCHQQAIKRVSDRRDDQMKKIAKSEYSVGGLGAMVRQMGMNDIQRDQALARLFEMECLNDSEYKMRVRMAYDGYSNALRALDLKRESMQQQQTQILNDITATQKQAGLDQNQAYSEAQTELQASRQTYVTDMQSMQNQLMTAQNSSQTKLDSMQTQIQLKQSSIDQKQGFLNSKNQLARDAEAAAHGSTYSKTDVDEIWKTLSASKTAAAGVASSCNCGKVGADEIACASANDFYQAAMGTGLPGYNVVGAKPPEPGTPDPETSSKPKPLSAGTGARPDERQADLNPPVARDAASADTPNAVDESNSSDN